MRLVEETNTTTQADTDPTLRRLRLVRGEHRWDIEWRPGDHRALLERLRELSEEPEAPLDHFDIALIRTQIARQNAGPIPGALKPGPHPAD
jgi:hypothetical protein